MKLRSYIYKLAHFGFLLTGWILYFFTRRTTYRAHQALVFFFCATAGRSNDWMSRYVKFVSMQLKFERRDGVIGDMSDEFARQNLKTLNEQGYVVFKQALPAAMCKRLMDFALTTPASVRRMDHEMAGNPARMAIYDPVKPLAVRYDYPVESLLSNPDVQTLLADHSLLALAQLYLGSRPKADVLSMWWHTNFHTQPDSEAAQFYHFDMDRIKWFKVFIYLTDVEADDGPHSFIAGSHKTNGIPKEFLQKGYVRLSDEEVLAHYGVDKQVEFTAPKGTIIVEDTRGLHKGKAVSGNSRLVLQLQFSNSLFGTQYPKAALTGPYVPVLADMIRRAPDIYESYL